MAEIEYKDRVLVTLPRGLKDDIKNIGYKNFSGLVSSLLEFVIEINQDENRDDKEERLSRIDEKILSLNEQKKDELSVLIEQLKNNRRKR